jgi:hypothetical protein
MENLKQLTIEEMNQTPQYKDLLKVADDMRIIVENLATAQEELKSATLEVFNETGEKKPIDKVEVKIYKKVEYDSLKVEAWCREFSAYLLVLDKKGFEKKAEDFKVAGAPVEIKEEAKCLISTDLSMYLTEEKGE